uniref:Uncharacterized protein n=1 Tax=Anguilla anguilla TaxID=7936 RepID=A0A0E9VEC6_ANGAN
MCILPSLQEINQTFDTKQVIFY